MWALSGSLAGARNITLTGCFDELRVFMTEQVRYSPSFQRLCWLLQMVNDFLGDKDYAMILESEATDAAMQLTLYIH